MLLGLFYTLRPCLSDRAVVRLEPVPLESALDLPARRLAIQSVILAYCYPNDGQLWSLHLPTSIDQIQIDLQLWTTIAGRDIELPFDSALSKTLQSGIYGDVALYTQYSEQAFLQLEGMQAVPSTGATSEDDRSVFSKMEWDLATPDGNTIVGSERASPEEYDLASTLERVAAFYLRSLDQEIPKSHPARENGRMTTWT